ncbi:MAG: 4-phosphopantetheinyl transferase [Solirubrobacteraceae bacterium]|nr:4-phosphopantetheinyl transferase [Solirubrobacteraceae bacterium]
MNRLELHLRDDEIHVWRASLDQDAALIASLERLLTDDEHERADRFRFTRDRERFVAGRGLLRTLLGGYLAVPPQDVRLHYGAHRKPVLAGAGPWFNVSHSGHLALFAFSASVELGIDIELAHSHPDGERIAEHFFSVAEVTELRSLPAEQRAAAFLTCWTRKEAFLKARGDGLTLPLDAFDVTLGPDRACALLRTAWSSEEPGHWRLVDLSDPSRGYVAALAARDHARRVSFRDLPRIPVHEPLMTLQEMT